MPMRFMFCLPRSAPRRRPVSWPFRYLRSDANPCVVEVVADLGRDLVVGHLVGGLDGYDSVAELGMIKALFELPLGLARSEDEDGFGVADCGHDLVVVPVKVRCEFALLAVGGFDLPILVVTGGGSNGRIVSRVLLDIGGDFLHLFAVGCNGNDQRFAMVDPQSCCLLHFMLLVRENFQL